tara:strand:+ start:280 stop:564 length:285 start_codon:yes stop_codon:yes gene_type:complete
MNRIFTIILVVLFSSSVFAYNYDGKKPINAYEMLLTRDALDTRNDKGVGGPRDRMGFSIICIDGYRYLFTNKGVTQMMFNDVGRVKALECPIKE